MHSVIVHNFNNYNYYVYENEIIIYCYCLLLLQLLGIKIQAARIPLRFFIHLLNDGYRLVFTGILYTFCFKFD